MKLFELFKKEAKWNWTKQDDWVWTTQFWVNDIHYIVEIIEETFGTPEKTDNWQIVFRVAGSGEKSIYEPTEFNKGQFIVLSTVMSIMSAFIALKRPKTLSFSGDKKNKLGDLYLNLVARMESTINSYGYDIDFKDWNYDFDIILFKKDQ